MSRHVVYEDGSKYTKTKDKPRIKSLSDLVIELILPYRPWLLIIFIAMLIETAMGLAAPWPLKIIIDNVIRNENLPHWLSWMNTLIPGEHAMALAGAAALALVVFTAIGGLAGYIDNYLSLIHI